MNKKLMLFPIEEYAKAQTKTLFERLASQVGQTAKSTDPEAVHDLRGWRFAIWQTGEGKARIKRSPAALDATEVLAQVARDD